MGWWKITPGNPGLHLGDDPKELPELFNGDRPADIVQAAIYGITKEYEEAWGRPPYLEELEAAIDFVMRKYRHPRAVRATQSMIDLGEQLDHDMSGLKVGDLIRPKIKRWHPNSSGGKESKPGAGTYNVEPE
jgi:hypothetical protein